MNIVVNGWEKKLDHAMKTGKGKFASCLVSDIHDYKRIIKIIRSGDLIKAYNMACYLDTSAREEIPMTVWNMLEKEYFRVNE